MPRREKRLLSAAKTNNFFHFVVEIPAEKAWNFFNYQRIVARTS